MISIYFRAQILLLLNLKMKKYNLLIDENAVKHQVMKQYGRNKQKHYILAKKSLNKTSK